MTLLLTNQPIIVDSHLVHPLRLCPPSSRNHSSRCRNPPHLVSSTPGRSGLSVFLSTPRERKPLHTGTCRLNDTSRVSSMPRIAAVVQDREVTVSSSTVSFVSANRSNRALGSHTLKRGRPTEPRVQPSPCMEKCCAIGKPTGLVLLPSTSSSLCQCSTGPTDELEDSVFQWNNDDAPEFEDEDFCLGPPPPCRPMLIRQNAMDATVTLETKLAAAPMPLRREHTSAGFFSKAPPSRGGPSTASPVGQPLFFRQPSRRGNY